MQGVTFEITKSVDSLRNATAAAKQLLKTYAITDFASAAHTHILSDVDDLVSSLAAKQATLVSGTNIKTVNNTSLLGSGNITIATVPAGSASEIQYRSSGSFGALSGSSVSGANITIGGTIRATGSLIIDAGSGNPTIDYTLVRDSVTGLLDVSSPQGGIYSGIKVSAISFTHVLSDVNVTDYNLRFGGNDTARYLCKRDTSNGILTITGNQVGYTGLNLFESTSMFFSIRPGIARVYNTYTDGSNYERGFMQWSGNAFKIGVEAVGTGTTRVVHISNLPTSNPGAGILWNNAGTPAIGT